MGTLSLKSLSLLPDNYWAECIVTFAFELGGMGDTCGKIWRFGRAEMTDELGQA